MQFMAGSIKRGLLGAATVLLFAVILPAQQSAGPQTDAPPPVAAPPAQNLRWLLRNLRALGKARSFQLRQARHQRLRRCA